MKEWSNIFPAQIFFYIQALYEYESMSTDTWIQYVGTLLECNIIECLHLYEDFKVHIRRLANPLHFDSP